MYIDRGFKTVICFPTTTTNKKKQVGRSSYVRHVEASTIGRSLVGKDAAAAVAAVVATIADAVVARVVRVVVVGTVVVVVVEVVVRVRLVESEIERSLELLSVAQRAPLAHEYLLERVAELLAERVVHERIDGARRVAEPREYAERLVELLAARLAKHREDVEKGERRPRHNEYEIDNAEHFDGLLLVVDRACLGATARRLEHANGARDQALSLRYLLEALRACRAALLQLLLALLRHLERVGVALVLTLALALTSSATERRVLHVLIGRNRELTASQKLTDRNSQMFAFFHVVDVVSVSVSVSVARRTIAICGICVVIIIIIIIIIIGVDVVVVVVVVVDDGDVDGSAVFGARLVTQAGGLAARGHIGGERGGEQAEQYGRRDAARRLRVRQEAVLAAATLAAHGVEFGDELVQPLHRQTVHGDHDNEWNDEGEQRAVQLEVVVVDEAVAVDEYVARVDALQYEYRTRE